VARSPELILPLLVLALLGASLAPAAAPAPGRERLGKLRASGPLVIAHRGASESHPENTLPAFRAALEAKAPIVELDTYETEDGAIVCFHDATLDRTTDGEARFGKECRIATLTLEEVATLDAGAWKHAKFKGTRVPTLEAALEAIGTQRNAAITMIERKEGRPETLLALLDRLRCRDRVVVQSFDFDFLVALRKLDRKVTIGALGEGPLDEDKLARISTIDPAFVHWRGRDLTPAAIRAAQARGLLVFAYTLNDTLSFAGAAVLGIDGITTDRPAALRELLKDPAIGGR
jgi:glycerophosphoryl diester phosphodiesterase